MKKTHTYYIQKKVGGKQEEVKDDGEDGTTFSCMCGSFCSDLGQLEKEREIIISVEQSSWMDFTAFNCSQQQVLLLFFTL